MKQNKVRWTRWCGCAATVMVLLLAGCASAPPMPEGDLEVHVVSEPVGMEVAYKERAVGVTPLDLRMVGLEDTAWLRVEAPKDKVLERRIQILGPDEVTVRFTVSEEPGTVAKALGLTDVVVFDYGNRASFEKEKFDLKPIMEPMLKTQAKLLGTQFQNVDAYVCGHTDSSGSDDFNQLLSVKRARAVADFLTANGVDAARLNVQGFGEDYPLAPNDTPEGQALNRRTEIILGGR